MMERTLSALMLVSIVTVAAPLLARPDAPSAAIETSALESRAHALTQDFAAYLEREDTQMIAAQMMAAAASLEVTPSVAWSPAFEADGGVSDQGQVLG